MKQFQKPKNMNLGELINKLGEGDFGIPDSSLYNPKRDGIRNLIKSILEGYYIGTLAIWKINKKIFELFNCKNIKDIYDFKLEKKYSSKYIVLDGQQRLGALYYTFFLPGNFPQSPYRRDKNAFLYFIDINKLLEKNFEEEIIYESDDISLLGKESQFESHYFPLGVMQGGTYEVENWVNEYRDYWQNQKEECSEEIRITAEGKIIRITDKEIEKETQEYDGYIENAEKLKKEINELLEEYQISYIELDEDIEVGKIFDILANSKDILNIIRLFQDILDHKGISDTRIQYILEDKGGSLYLDLYNDYYDITDFCEHRPSFWWYNILKVMSIRLQNYCSPKYLYYLLPNVEKTIKNEDEIIEKTVLNKDRETFIKQFNEAVEETKSSINKLKNPREYGVIKSEYIPCKSIIPVFTAINTFATQEENIDKTEAEKKIKYWYFISILLERYSRDREVSSTSAKDYIDMKEWLVDDYMPPDYISGFDMVCTAKNLKFYNSTVNNLVFNILIIKGARDWVTFYLPEYEKLDFHYIVPLSWLKANDLNDDTILNKTPLTEKINEEIIGDKLPNEYLKEMIKKSSRKKIYDLMSSHLISKDAVDILLRDGFGIDDYRDFLEERKKTIIQGIKEVCDIPDYVKRYCYYHFHS